MSPARNVAACLTAEFSVVGNDDVANRFAVDEHDIVIVVSVRIGDP